MLNEDAGFFQVIAHSPHGGDAQPIHVDLDLDYGELMNVRT